MKIVPLALEFQNRFPFVLDLFVVEFTVGIMGYCAYFC